MFRALIDFRIINARTRSTSCLLKSLRTNAFSRHHARLLAALTIRVHTVVKHWYRKNERKDTEETLTDSFRRAFLPLLPVGALLLCGPLALSSSCYDYEQREDGSVDRLHRWSSRTWNRPIGTNPGWQIHGPHPLLERHAKRLIDNIIGSQQGVDPAVLVPLCGKTHDMPYLGELGFGVVGVEGVPRAIREFCKEQRMCTRGFLDRIVMTLNSDGSWSEDIGFEPATSFVGEKLGRVFKLGCKGLGYYADSPSVWRGMTTVRRQAPKPLHLIQGDMFEVTPALVAAATFVKDGVFDLIYDRASLVSIPPAAREEYVAVLTKLVKPHGQILLIAEDYDQSLVPVDPLGRRRGPPPFALPLPEVQRLFPQQGWSIEVLERVQSDLQDGGNPSFAGVAVSEVVYLLVRRPAVEANQSSTYSYMFATAIVGIALAVTCSLVPRANQ